MWSVFILHVGSRSWDTFHRWSWDSCFLCPVFMSNPQVTSVLLVGRRRASSGKSSLLRGSAFVKDDQEGPLWEFSTHTKQQFSFYWIVLIDQMTVYKPFWTFLSRIHFESLKKKVLWYSFEEFRCSIICCLFCIFLMEKKCHYELSPLADIIRNVFLFPSG